MKFKTIVQWLVLLSFVLAFGYSIAFGQEPASPTNVMAFDTPNDSGASITITWDKSPDEGAAAASVTGYNVLRKAPGG